MLDLNIDPSDPPRLTRYDLDRLSDRLRDRAADIVPRLFPNGVRDGHEWRLASIDGRAPRKDGSCAIKMKGEKAFDYYDHATGEGGGPIKTYAKATGLKGRALLEAIEREIGDAAPKTNGYSRSRAVEDAGTSREIEIRFAVSQSVDLAGTFGETYLNSRGLENPRSADVLFNPNLTDWEAKRGRPAIVSIIRDPVTTEPTGGIHRIFLRDDGSAKADIPKAKMMLGPSSGVVMLAPMVADGVLGIAEGIETTLAAGKIFNIPVWAGLSAGGVQNFAFPPALKKLVIFADRGADGEGAATALLHRARNAGIDACVYRPHSDDDFATDLLTGNYQAGSYGPWEPPLSDVTTAEPAGNRRRALSGDEPKDRGLPFVRISGGSLPATIDAAENILIDSDSGIFQRGDFVVRAAPEPVAIADRRETVALRLVPVKMQHMVERFTTHVDFQKYNIKQRQWVSTDCPSNVAAAYLERVGEWKLRPLAGITNAPTLRPDGSILDQPGYDRATGILLDPRGVAYPPIPPEPTIDDARAVLALLKGLIREFPFVPDDEWATDPNAPSASRSVALAGILTAVLRRSVPQAPMHAYTAPSMGTGKSKLVDLAAMIAVGHEAPVLAQGKTEEEMEKRLGAALLAGDQIISFDNCEAPIGGELLCQALTQPTLSIRILGKSDERRRAQ